MKILLIEPMKKPRVLEIDHTLSEMQKLVGGDIDIIYPWEDDPVCLVCNDNFIAEELPFNRVIGNTIIQGNFFIAGLGETDLCDLPEELITKYKMMFE